MQTELKLKAYAKINLFLDIDGTLPGGMHKLDMIMRRIGLYDEVLIKKRSEGILLSEMNDIVPERNIAFRAAKLFFVYSKICGGAEIEIKKNIPFMSGMGGGSADAAAVLNGLNRLYGKPFNMDELMKMGLCLGADVPFSLLGGCARAGGVGEELIPIMDKLPAFWLIVKPFGGVSTKEAFELYDKIGQSGEKGSIEGCIRALEMADFELFAQNTYNALEEAAVVLEPEIKECIEEIQGSGAIAAFMTGSGSSCVGLFSEKEAAEKAKEAFDGRYELCTVVTSVD